MDKITLLKLHCQEIPPQQGPLAPEAITSSLKAVPEWKSGEKKIERKIVFKNFVMALEFVNDVGRLAEAEQHHPDIFIHYNQVTFSLWTHTVGGLSTNDFIMATKIDALYARG
ncbi:MAG: 4a-hydroxytetrahydrobiopterin dehydratase [Deltaproteobacteria bacterium]|nr:4a-hydroxytetrahydrobiopterin dehydratase [Deltaproteobacteria bacterium]MBI3293148.1 4a-hydroxytetrahydrobiopterin dehydratase [Deltaproteobacteria bacterium]